MSDGAGKGQEKSHEASPQKLERARKKGELARSPEVQTALAYLGLFGSVLVAGGWSAVLLGETLMGFLARPEELAALFATSAGAISAEVFGRVGLALLPFFLAPALLILAILAAQRSIVLASDKLKPKLSRISPVQNAKQKYGAHGLMEFLKSAVKLTAVAVVLALAVVGEVDHLPGYVKIGPRQLPALLAAQFWNIATGVLILALAVAAIDLLWQRHSHRRKMRMTHQELKDETKQSEGDPQMRASRRERGREIASNRMLHDVVGADVVITNPTHVAVALKWSRTTGTVPVCVAKGADELARRIRVKAEGAGVPIHQDPPTARALHATVEPGQPIRPEHFRAVAAAIVFADGLREKRRERTGRTDG